MHSTALMSTEKEHIIMKNIVEQTHEPEPAAGHPVVQSNALYIGSSPLLHEPSLSERTVGER